MAKIAPCDFVLKIAKMKGLFLSKIYPENRHPQKNYVLFRRSLNLKIFFECNPRLRKMDQRGRLFCSPASELRSYFGSFFRRVQLGTKIGFFYSHFFFGTASLILNSKNPRKLNRKFSGVSSILTQNDPKNE